MIAVPLNDPECLAKLTQVAAGAIASREIQTVAGRFLSTRELAAWIRSLPQRNDTADPNDGPRVACPDVSQRARIVPPPPDPNCVERSILYLAAAEILDPVPVRQLVTIETAAGRHTFPVEDGRAVVLDPSQSRNALNAGVYRVVQASGGVRNGSSRRELSPRNVLRWIARIAEEPAESLDGKNGRRRVARARVALAQLLEGTWPSADHWVDIAFTLRVGIQAAGLWGPDGICGARAARAFLDKVTQPKPSKVADERAASAASASNLRNVSWGQLGSMARHAVDSPLGRAVLRSVGLEPVVVLAEELSTKKKAPGPYGSLANLKRKKGG